MKHKVIVIPIVIIVVALAGLLTYELNNNKGIGSAFRPQAGIDLLGSADSYQTMAGGYTGGGTASSTPQRIEGLKSATAFVGYRGTSIDSTLVCKVEYAWDEDRTYWYEEGAQNYSIPTTTIDNWPKEYLYAIDTLNEATTTIVFDFVEGSKYAKVSCKTLDGAGSLWAKWVSVQEISR